MSAVWCTSSPIVVQFLDKNADGQGVLISPTQTVGLVFTWFLEQSEVK